MPCVQAEIVSEWASKSVIKSHARLTYDHAQRVIEQPDVDWDDSFPSVHGPYTSIDVVEAVLMYRPYLALHMHPFSVGL